MNHLPKTDKCAEDDGAPSYPQDTVDEEPTKHRQDDIGPGVQRVEKLVACCINVHHLGGSERGEGGRGGGGGQQQ